METHEISQRDAEIMYATATRLKELKVGEQLSDETIEELSYYSGFLYGTLIRLGFVRVPESVTRE